jgi:hypothetical protein
MVVNWAVSEIDLSDAAFGVLRRERPVAFFPEPAPPHLPVRITPSRRGG